MALSESDKKLAVNTALYIGGAYGAYYFIIKPLLEKVGLKKTEAEEAQEKLQKAGREKFIVDTIKKPDTKQAAKGKQTRPEGQFAIWADQIYEYLKYTKLDDKKVFWSANRHTKRIFLPLPKIFCQQSNVGIIVKVFKQ